MRETDLYPPIRDYLEANGYTVRSEVLHCDITAVKDDDLIIIELKKSANISLLIQATKRQMISDSVYVAVPKPKPRRAHWQGVKRILRRLELGLITVNLRARKRQVEVVFDPLPHQRRKQSQKRRAVLQEIADRSGEYNVAGSTRTKLVTAYRENAVLIGCCLRRFGPLSAKQLRDMGSGEKTSSILYNNYYDWFQRIRRGVYQLTGLGEQQLSDYPQIERRSLEIIDSVAAPKSNNIKRD